MKYLLLLSLFAFVGRFAVDDTTKHKGKLTITYDKFKNVTSATMAVKLPPVIGGNRSLTMMATYTYPGRTFQKPEKVLLSFYANSRDWIFLDDWQRSFIALIDAKRINYGTMQRFGNQIDSGGVVELAGVWVVPASFLDFATAKSAEIQLGRTAYKLKSEHLAAFREFAEKAQLIEGN